MKIAKRKVSKKRKQKLIADWVESILSLKFREIQLYFMSKIRSIHSNQVFLKNILDRKNLKYGANYTIDNQWVLKKNVHNSFKK